MIISLNKLSEYLKENRNYYELKKVFLTNREIDLIITESTLNNKKIILFNCEIELKNITNKQLRKIFDYIQIKESKLFINKKGAILKELEHQITKNNVIYLSDYCDYLLKKTGNDLRNINEKTMKKISLFQKDVRNVYLPNNHNFFQLIRNKEVVNTKLPDIDFNNYNMTDVSFRECKFSDKTIMSKSFFQEIKEKKLIGCTLPPIEFEKDFIQNSIFMFVKFHNKTKFPKNVVFFKNFPFYMDVNFHLVIILIIILQTPILNFACFPKNQSYRILHILQILY